MKPVILFVVGAPGVGKTTLVRGLLGDPNFQLMTEDAEPKWTAALEPEPGAVTSGVRAVAAGWYKGETFDGCDTVPYSGASAALAFWAESLWSVGIPLTIFDGARFSTGSSLTYVRGFAKEVGAAIVGVHLVASEIALAARRAARGSNQAPAWIKGATTGAANFARKLGAIEIAAGDPADVLRQVRDVIDKTAE